MATKRINHWSTITTPIRVKAIRDARGWGQSELAEAVGAKLRAVQYWEAGKFVPIRPFQMLLERLEK